MKKMAVIGIIIVILIILAAVYFVAIKGIINISGITSNPATTPANIANSGHGWG